MDRLLKAKWVGSAALVAVAGLCIAPPTGVAWGWGLAFAAGVGLWLRAPTPAQRDNLARPTVEGRAALGSKAGAVVLSAGGDRFLVIYGDQLARVRKLGRARSADEIPALG